MTASPTNGKRTKSGVGMGISLSTAEFVSFWANWLLVGALVVGVIATWAIVVSGNVKEAALKRDVAAANQSAGAANERAAQLEKEATEARAEIARANERTEKLRADNLALQKLMQPRRLGTLFAITSVDAPDVPPAAEMQFEGIRRFAGTPVVIQVVPDFEAQTLANDMVLVLRAFGWHPQTIGEAESHVPPSLISDGVQVTFPHGSKLYDAAQALATGFTNAGLTGPAGWGLSSIVAQGYPVNLDGTPEHFPGYPIFSPPVDTVIVMVGMKPIPPAQ
jgi:hypothetical protein